MYKSWALPRRKALDLDVMVITPSRHEPTQLTLGCEVCVRYNTDHSGISMSLNLLFICIEIHFYDTKHMRFTV